MRLDRVAALVWGLVGGLVLAYAATDIRPATASALVGCFALFLIGAVLWDEWQHPANSWTSRS